MPIVACHMPQFFNVIFLSFFVNIALQIQYVPL